MPRRSLKDPRNIRAALKQWREEFFMLLGQRQVMKLRRERADVKVAEPGTERVQQIATSGHRLVD